MRSQETKTIQVWPGGQSYTFRGDPDGPANQKSLKTRRFNGEPQPATWRKGTAAEWRSIRIELRAEMYWEQDGMGCDSALVDDLLKASHELYASPVKDLSDAFSIDEIRNLYADPSDWNMERCREYMDDHGLDAPGSAPDPWTLSIEGCIELLQAVAIDAQADEGIEVLRSAVIANMDDETLDGLNEWRAACRDHAQDNPAEVYEWWRVSQWLCDQLHAIGEVTIDNGYGHWWGRTCTGQSLLMDGTLQQIAAQYEREG